MMKSLVSVNILTSKGGRKFIESCLLSINQQTYQPLEISIMDNDSNDGTKEFIEQNYPNIKLIKNKKNIGFSAGHNQLIKQSKGEFILCVNQDTILDKEFINNAIKEFQSDKKIGAIQPKILGLKKTEVGYKKTNIIDTTGLLIFKDRRVFNRGQGEKDIGQFDKKEEIFGADGALPLFRRTALENIKMPKQNKDNFYEFFDEDFFAYKEDVDLAWRLRLTDWKIIYCPHSIGWHARTTGPKPAFWKIINQRRKISNSIKCLSFKNQRLVQIKNEIPLLFLKHLPWIILKEIKDWLYIFIFEIQTFKIIKDLLKQIPLAFQKRKFIMANKKITIKEMSKWFN